MSATQTEQKKPAGAKATGKDTPLVKYTPGKSCVQQGKEHRYEKVRGKNYMRCETCGSTRTVHPEGEKPSKQTKAGGKKAPAKAGEVEISAGDTVPAIAAAARRVKAAAGGPYSVRYMRSAIWTMERGIPDAAGALGFAAPASYNTSVAVEVLRDGAVVATYKKGALKSEDAEILAAIKEVVEGGDDYTASVNGARTPNGGLTSAGGKVPEA